MTKAEKPSVALVFLTFNEIDGVTALLPKMTNLFELGVDRLFAVDGGSTDGTLDVFARHGVAVHKQKSRGRGEAMRLAAATAEEDYLVFFSPDGNEDLYDIAKFRPLFAQGYDLVIGSRMMLGARNEEDEHLLKPRKWVNNAFNLAANILFRRTPGYVSDSINGFRGIRRALFIELDLDAVGYTIEYQMTMRCLQRRARIAEFPTHEGNRIGGETKAASIPTGIAFIKCLWRETMANLPKR